MDKKTDTHQINTEDFGVDKKRNAQIMYWASYPLAEISRQLNIPLSTLSSWKNREKWDDYAPVSKVEMAIETRMILLTLKEQKSGHDFKELDLLGRQLERTARVKKYTNGGGNESTLNPRIQNRNSGERKVKDKNPITPEQEELLINSFLNSMFFYQRAWHDAGLRFRIRNILKSRQIGATYYFAHEAFIDALKTGRNQIFISASKKQALQFRAYIVEYARKVADVELKGETILLPNGAELIFLGTNSKTAQSYHGNLYIDEIFWINQFETLRKVSSGMASQKQYRQTYFSTPSTLAHDAYPFWSGARFNRGRPKEERVELDLSHENLKKGVLCDDGQWRQIVNIEDAERGGCNLFDISQLKLEYSHDEFEQLFMCQFIDDSESVFRYSTLQKCAVDSVEEWNDYNPMFERPFGQREVWLGYDPSNTGDRAALAIIAPPKVDGGTFRVIHVETFHGLDYEAQAAKIESFCHKYHVTRICIDETGLGSAVYQLVKTFFPAVMGITYNLENKSSMVLKAHNLMEKGRFEYDLGDRDIPTSFMTIKKVSTQSGRNVTYKSERTEDANHGDIAWAIMHTLNNEPFGGMKGIHKPQMSTF